MSPTFLAILQNSRPLSIRTKTLLLAALSKLMGMSGHDSADVVESVFRGVHGAQELREDVNEGGSGQSYVQVIRIGEAPAFMMQGEALDITVFDAAMAQQLANRLQELRSQRILSRCNSDKDNYINDTPVFCPHRLPLTSDGLHQVLWGSEIADLTYHAQFDRLFVVPEHTGWVGEVRKIRGYDHEKNLWLSDCVDGQVHKVGAERYLAVQGFQYAGDNGVKLMQMVFSMPERWRLQSVTFPRLGDVARMQLYQFAKEYPFPDLIDMFVPQDVARKVLSQYLHRQITLGSDVDGHFMHQFCGEHGKEAVLRYARTDA